MDAADISTDAFRMATLQSERARILGLLFILTALASALGFTALAAYTVLAYPAGPRAETWAHFLPIHVTYGLFFLISGSAAAGLTAQFRRHLLAALREAETRRRFERLEREVA